MFEWSGKDKTGRQARGEIRAQSEEQAKTLLRRQGIFINKIKKRNLNGGKAIRPKDIAVFTRQMATMIRAGVPLLQAFEIVAQGNPNPRVTRLLMDIRADVETGTALHVAFRKFPLYFNNLYVNMVEAGEAAGILEAQMARLATYMEKNEAIKAKVKTAMFYPAAVVGVAFGVVTLIMLVVIPKFNEIFKNSNTELPLPTRVVVAMSDFFVSNWWLIFAILFGGIYGFMWIWKRNKSVQHFMDRFLLRIPVVGLIVDKSCITRWARTLSTMFSAGVPLTDALDSVAGASGNIVYEQATQRIRSAVSAGSGVTAAMTLERIFPPMLVQLAAIGEESGALDDMLGKAADFYEDEVDQLVARLSALLEPFIIVVLAIIIGGILVAMYMPLFKLGQVV